MDTKKILLMLVALLLWQNSSAWGRDLRYSNMDRRLATLEKKINQKHRAKPASWQAAKPSEVDSNSRAAFLSDDEDDSDDDDDTECGESCDDAGCCDCCESCDCGESCTCGESSDCGESCGCADQCGQTNYCGKYYTEVQITWMRTHINEDVVGKLSEQYKFTPRLIMGYEDPNGVGARIRYWRYNHTTETVRNRDEIVLDFTTVDFEATSRFQTRRTDLVLAGGFRWFDGEIGSDGRAVNSQMPGFTVAGDLRSVFCGNCRSQWATVGGARWSILGGNWEGRSGLVDPTRDDNLVVQELYGGVEYACHRGGMDIYTRLVLEVQNWRSDVIGNQTDTDSIGLIGPGVHFGANF